MLKPKKKLTRREIKQDKLVSTYFKAYDKVYNARKTIFVTFGVLAMVFIGYLLYTNNIKSENRQATTELGKVYSYYDSGDYELAIHGIPEQNINGLRDIAQNFEKTNAGQLAAFYAANAYYHTGDYDNAYRFFDMYRGKDPLLQASVLAGKASIYEIRGEFLRAAELFEQAATRFGETAITPENLKHAGLNYIEAGEKQKAMHVLEKIKNEYPESAVARDIDRFIAQISVAL
jgi:tetratricopeptide (TPR) repeat protein